MNPAADVAWICDHQALVITILTWAIGAVPIASALTWWTDFYAKLPYWLQSVLQFLAGNFIQVFVTPKPLPPKQ